MPYQEFNTTLDKTLQWNLPAASGVYNVQSYYEIGSSSVALTRKEAEKLPAEPEADPLPDELLCYVFSFLSADDLREVRQTCRRWRYIGSDMHLWRRLYHIDWTAAEEASPLCLSLAPPVDWTVAYQRQLKELKRIERNWTLGAGRCAEYIQFQSFVRSFRFNQRYLVVGFFDGSICTYDFTTKTVTTFAEHHIDQVVTLDFDQDVLVTGSGPPFWLDRTSIDNTVKIWSVSRHACLHTCFGHTGGVVAVRLGKRFLATAARDRSIIIWSRGDWRPLHRLEGHTGLITGLQWIERNSSNYELKEPILVSASSDGSLRMWSSWTGASLAIHTFPPNGHPPNGVRSLHYYRGELLLGFYSGRVALYKVDLRSYAMNLVREYVRPCFVEPRPVISVQFDHTKVACLCGDQVIRVLQYSTGDPLFNMFGLTIFCSHLQFDRTRLISDGRNFIIDVHDFSGSIIADDPLIQVLNYRQQTSHERRAEG